MTANELTSFTAAQPEIEMVEVLMPDMNGIFRCKRIHRSELATLYDGGLKSPVTMPLMTTMGEFEFGIDAPDLEGERDVSLLPIANTLVPVPWLESPTAQVVVSHQELDGDRCWVDPRHVLAGVLDRFAELGLRPVVATELEFYLVAAGEGERPRPLLGDIPGTGLKQSGTQYAMADDLWQYDSFLNDVRLACATQHVPLTTIHCEFSPGQWEINTRHCDDPLLACDHAMLLKRIVKGVALKHGISATFMAKPFAETGGSGLHVHASLYDEKGQNVFAGNGDGAEPDVSQLMRHAIGGMAKTMAPAMAIFAPNANSYRRYGPGSYVPLYPHWGYNHRNVPLRIPLSSDNNRRIEHRVAGADANPYLVVAAVLAGMHYGITQQSDPGPMVAQSAQVPEEQAVLPDRWEKALDLFDGSEVMKSYLGDNYFAAFSATRRLECNEFHARISNLDYEWYLRAL